MESSLHQPESPAQPSLDSPSLLDWYSLAPDPEIRVLSYNAASALAHLAAVEALHEGNDIEFVGIGVTVKGQRINGISRGDVQGFRESETYPYTES